MKIYKITLLFAVCTLLCSAQEQISIDSLSSNFPASWEGKWKGQLEIYNAIGKVQELPMELHIIKSDTSDSYSYSIIYGPDAESGLRPYELIIKDKSKGVYLIDEHNSIKIESYFIHDKFLSWFEVQNALIQTMSERRGETLFYEIIAGSSVPVSKSGNTKMGEEEIPEVKTYPINVIQRATLYRKDK